MTPDRASALLEHIRAECEACQSFVEGVDRDEFLSNAMIQHAVAMCVIAIGEAMSRLVQTDPEFVAAHPAIPWRSIVGMRNRIAHGYYALDFEVVWDTAQDSIPELLASLPARDD